MRAYPMRFTACLLAGLVLAAAAGLARGTPATIPEGEPRWSFSAAAMAGRLPHYRGSDEYRNYVFPVLFFVYRGKIFEADRDGTRGIFWRPAWGQLDLSLSGNPPVGSNDARTGMPDLDPLIEIGPALRIHLHRPQSGPSAYLQANWRTVSSLDTSDFGLAYEGMRGGLSLHVKGFSPSLDPALRLGMSVGLEFADRWYNRYFYEVTPDQAREDRPVYRARGGYSGFHVSAHAVRRISRRVTCGLYTRWDSLYGAAYEDSPLVKTRNNLMLGAGLIWTFAESASRAYREP